MMDVKRNDNCMDRKGIDVVYPLLTGLVGVIAIQAPMYEIWGRLLFGPTSVLASVGKVHNGLTAYLISLAMALLFTRLIFIRLARVLHCLHVDGCREVFPLSQPNYWQIILAYAFMYFVHDSGANTDNIYMQAIGIISLIAGLFVIVMQITITANKNIMQYSKCINCERNRLEHASNGSRMLFTIIAICLFSLLAYMFMNVIVPCILLGIHLPSNDIPLQCRLLSFYGFIPVVLFCFVYPLFVQNRIFLPYLLPLSNINNLVTLTIASLTGVVMICIPLHMYERKIANELLLAGTHYSQHQVIAIALARGANVNTSNHKGKTPLILSAINSDWHSIVTLLSFGADINQVTNDGLSPLHYASFNTSAKIVALLIQNGAIVDRESTNGMTPLVSAIYNGGSAVARLLIDNGANVNHEHNEGMTPLMVASAVGNIEIMNMLLAHNAYIDHQDRYGLSALSLSVSKGNIRAVQILLDHHADVNTITFNGHTPLLIATHYHYDSIAKLLRDCGAKQLRLRPGYHVTPPGRRLEELSPTRGGWLG